MNLYIRLVWALLHAAFGKQLSIADVMNRPPRLPLIAFPNDLDLNWHVNNGRLATLFDLGFMHLLGRGRMLRLLLRNRMAPIIGGILLKYRHPVNVFSRFVIETRLLCWDHKWFYCRHRLIIDGDRIAVSAISRSCLVRGGRTVMPSEFMSKMAFDAPSPDPTGAANLFESVNGTIDADAQAPADGNAHANQPGHGGNHLIVSDAA